MRIIILLCALLQVSILQTAYGKPLKIEPINKTEEDCGCDFGTGKSGDLHTYAWSEAGELATSDSLKVNLGEGDLVLRKSDSKLMDSKGKPQTSELKKGDKFKETFNGRGIQVTLDYSVTQTCSDVPLQRADSCEGTSFDAKMTVTRGGDKASMDLKVGCGC
jgi:hypothetical protein